MSAAAGAQGAASPGSDAAPGWTWVALALALASAALAAWTLPPAWLDWRAELAWAQPWRWWTAALVHWSPLHLGANLAGCVVLGAYGRAAGAGRELALAWLMAWPLTQLGLLLDPGIRPYGGLSGVLHAGVAVVAAALVVNGRGRRRGIGLAVALGLMIKLLFERPWEGGTVSSAGWDIRLAPLAHATGAAAGALTGVAAALAMRRGREARA